MRLLKLCALLATLTAAGATAAHADTAGPPWGPETPNFNLEAVLRPAAGLDTGFGLVKFRQPNDDAKIVLLDVWVRDLLPNHDYYLRRAVDASVDDTCTGTNWLKLGQASTPSMPTVITTDDSGTARASLSRNLAAFPSGTEFDIHFDVIDATTGIEVLRSDCYQFTVDP